MSELSLAIPTYNRSRFVLVRGTIFVILILAYMLVFFHRMAPAVVSSDLMRAFGTTGAALGSLAAMYFYIYTTMQIPAGIIADTVGARASVTVGNLVAGCGSIIFGLAGSFASASLGRALVGLGVSVIFVGLMKSNSLWFSERNYGLISGLTLLLGNIGASLRPALWPPCSRSSPGARSSSAWALLPFSSPCFRRCWSAIALKTSVFLRSGRWTANPVSRRASNTGWPISGE